MMSEDDMAENDLGAESDLGPDLPFDPQELMKALCPVEEGKAAVFEAFADGG